MFMRVVLHGRSGETAAIVTIPQFRLAPEALLWGGRCFTKVSTKSGEDLYVECFAVQVVPIPGVAKNDGTD